MTAFPIFKDITNPFFNIQEVLTLTLAILVTHDELSTINAIGLVICLLGITLHMVLKVGFGNVVEFINLVVTIFCVQAFRMHRETKASAANSLKGRSGGEEELLMEPLNSDSEEIDLVVRDIRQ